MSWETKHFYEFSEFRFEIEKRVLWRDGEMLGLTPKAAEVLALLLAQSGSLVERQELLDKVWSNTFVEEGNLNTAISALRRVVGNDLIQTVPRRGYRLTAEVREVWPQSMSEIVVEKRTISETMIEEQENRPGSSALLARPSSRRPVLAKAAMVVFVLVGLSVGVWYAVSTSSRNKAAARASIDSLAVLPLKSFSRDNLDEELRLRITDALITRLGRFDELVVRPTSSVVRFAGEQHDVIEAGKFLGVDAVLDGRVQEENGRLRVTLQLISVPDGDQLWSEQFDGRSGEILALQDLISNRFGQDLVLRNTRDAARRPVLNNDAYEAYLKGRYLWNQRRLETYYKALEYFEKSIEIDPDFALGYTGISDTYHLLQQRNAISTKDAFDKAELAARKALELDPHLSEAYVSMGAVSQIRYLRWQEAERFYLRAIELNPNLSDPYGRIGMLYNSWGRFDEARTMVEKAVELDPTSLNNGIYLGAYYYFSKQYDQAIRQFHHILEFAPGTERSHFFLTRIYELTGDYDQAVDHALKERAISRPETVEPLRRAYEQFGIKGFWRKQIEILETESTRIHDLENHIASRYVLLGEFDRACDYIELNLSNLGSLTNYGRVDPIFEKLWNHPRYMAAMSKSATPS